MPLLEESRPRLSPGTKAPASMQPSSSENPKITTKNPPKPRAVQLSKRRQSGKGPVGDGADLVVAQIPAPANHRVSKRSHSHRSPKITHTAKIPNLSSHISPISPLPIRHPPASVIRSCIVCSSHAFVDAFPCQMHTGEVANKHPKQSFWLCSTPACRL
jgi:hypothetical protein